MHIMELLPYLIPKYRSWITEQHKVHRACARPLSAAEKASLKGYFDERILETVRVATVDRISNPSFYDEFNKTGTSVLFDLTQSASITLIDCVLVCRIFCLNTSSWMRLLFHELVHVQQYDVLGLERMVELYVTSWAQNSCQYEAIPFEQQAYELESKFILSLGTPFSVAEMVKQGLRKYVRTLS